jgi:hypothetical protein
MSRKKSIIFDHWRFPRLNEREYWAQGVRFYVTDPDLLAERDPALYAFVEESFLNDDF